jgi:hypothetical protein
MNSTFVLWLGLALSTGQVMIARIRRKRKMSKYRLIDDALCDVDPELVTYVNCEEDCPYFWDCMEEDNEEVEENA